MKYKVILLCVLLFVVAILVVTHCFKAGDEDKNTDKDFQKVLRKNVAGNGNSNVVGIKQRKVDDKDSMIPPYGDNYKISEIDEAQPLMKDSYGPPIEEEFYLWERVWESQDSFFQYLRALENEKEVNVKDLFIALQTSKVKSSSVNASDLFIALREVPAEVMFVTQEDFLNTLLTLALNSQSELVKEVSFDVAAKVHAFDEGGKAVLKRDLLQKVTDEFYRTSDKGVARDILQIVSKYQVIYPELNKFVMSVALEEKTFDDKLSSTYPIIRKDAMECLEPGETISVLQLKELYLSCLKNAYDGLYDYYSFTGILSSKYFAEIMRSDNNTDEFKNVLTDVLCKFSYSGDPYEYSAFSYAMKSLKDIEYGLFIEVAIGVSEQDISLYSTECLISIMGYADETSYVERSEDILKLCLNILNNQHIKRGHNDGQKECLEQLKLIIDVNDNYFRNKYAGKIKGTIAENQFYTDECIKLASEILELISGREND